MGQSDILFHPQGSAGHAAYGFVRLALPVYLAASYLPQIGWWVGKQVHKLTRACLQMPKEFTLYFLAGAIFGSLLGMFTGLEAGLLWPEWGMLFCVLAIATFSGWSLAVLRCCSGVEA
jgi:hypothetical protein